MTPDSAQAIFTSQASVGLRKRSRNAISPSAHGPRNLGRVDETHTPSALTRREQRASVAAVRLTSLRVYLAASFHAGFAYRLALVRLFDQGDAAMQASARFLERDSSSLRWNAEIVLARYLLIPARHRPHFRRTARLDNVRYGIRFGVQVPMLCAEFGVARSTLYRWQKRFRTAAPGATGIGSERVPVPPSTRIADRLRVLARDMKGAGFPGKAAIAVALRHAGIQVDKRSCGRFVAEGLGSPPARRTAHTPPLHLPRSEPALAAPQVRPLARAWSQARDALLLHLGALVRRFRSVACEQRQESTFEAATFYARRKERLRILLQHFGRIPPRHRPRYTPELRAEILAFKYRYRLSHQALARRFLIDPGTASDWNVRVDRSGQDLIQPRPPLRCAERPVARAVDAAFPGMRQEARSRLLAALVLLGAGLAVRRRVFPSRRPPCAEAERSWKPKAPIVATGPNHFRGGDLTVIGKLHLATILDLHSRRTLAFRLFPNQPSDDDLAMLQRRANAGFGKARHFVSDHGGQFVGEAFQAALAQTGTDHRLGAVGQHGSIAIVERCQRTIKDALDLEHCDVIVPALLQERLDAVMHWYDHLRPHSALGGATPAEVFAGVDSPAWHARPAPRGRPGEETPPLGIAIRFALELEQRLPYLERVA